MTTMTTRNDAVTYVEDRLGPDGSRALAEIFCTLTRWQDVAELSDEEWSNILNDAMAREADAMEATMTTTKQQTTYFVVAAPGHYGDRTRVVSSHRSLAAAKKSATAGYVVREGAKAKGDEFTRAAEAVYPVAR